ncbi:hypothetical protein QFC22_006434 [Naganishia vaughanmartiniae]|uniref:Uncharacterized protein n=1 Tax=Naganishia vaughanmartiniae TaxID=1424756 RepID=A0ACC2WJ44_9TREE|nr:hypothetical protein QFC22_006434 [Naganishia vaughanmartiniae]
MRSSASRSEEQEQDEPEQEEHRHKRQRTQTTTSHSPSSIIETFSPSSSQPPLSHRTQEPAGGTGRISHACRPCNRQKLKCDGRLPCSRCLVAVQTNNDALPPSSAAPEIGGEIDDEEKNRLSALEVCVYQPSMRGRTKRRRKNGPTDGGLTATARNSSRARNRRDGLEEADKIHLGSDNSQTAQNDLATRFRSTRALAPPTTTIKRNQEQRSEGGERTREGVVPTLQAAFYRSATLFGNPETVTAGRSDELDGYEHRRQEQRTRGLSFPAAAAADVDGSNTHRTTNGRRDDDDNDGDLKRSSAERYTSRSYPDSAAAAVGNNILDRQAPVPLSPHYRPIADEQVQPQSFLTPALPPDAPAQRTHLQTYQHHPDRHHHPQPHHQLPPLHDRAKLTPFPMPGDEMNPLGVLAEASASLERERERERERENAKEGDDDVQQIAAVGEQEEVVVAAAVASRSNTGTTERITDLEAVVTGGMRPPQRENAFIQGRSSMILPAARQRSEIDSSGSLSPRALPPHPAPSTTPVQPTETTTPDDVDAYYARPKQSTAGHRTLEGEAPHIMRLLTADDAHRLFDVYWRWFHPHLPVLDKDRSEPVDVASRSNYLFNASAFIVFVLYHWQLRR